MLRPSKDKKAAIKKADDYFSEFIRLRDSGKPCITCGTYISNGDCGHFMSRRFQSTRYDEKNANLQCGKCNRFENGNQWEHGLAIDKKFGEGTAHELYLKSKMTCQRNKYDFEQIAQKYADKIAELKKPL